ncbi:glycoside hydrolase family 16 protein [Fistulina hepatica ATCC 64428]|uniref:Glycoside hydrolase family 16 protein n=1 Tax=Fistulina hepatica ATCC 64428 TaxID=1128425 RepID=A0A0D7AJ44_9AGAR|nr:glycoside hydrolase family 16 protein [Fistulina hepatica ATCC 64428]
MLTLNFLSVSLLLLVVPSVYAATYALSETVVGTDFYDAFTFENITDPTDGRVTYVTEATAIAENLTYATDDTFILRTDYTTVLSADGPGRNSVRIKSINQYTEHVAVFNIRHMPVGCATWPAVWETNEADWPDGGEIDILEGVNDVPPDTISLHTAADCTMSPNSDMTGTWVNYDCSAYDDDNEGCSVQVTDADSYSEDFNSVGGGWYAVERTEDFIKVWFWSRTSSAVPSDASTGASTVDTDDWDTPDAYFTNTSCDIAALFGENNIIINLTLCGDWAGADYPSTCPSTCVDYVNDDPSGFVDAYFDFASINVYLPS